MASIEAVEIGFPLASGDPVEAAEIVEVLVAEDQAEVENRAAVASCQNGRSWLDLAALEAREGLEFREDLASLVAHMALAAGLLEARNFRPEAPWAFFRRAAQSCCCSTEAAEAR